MDAVRRAYVRARIGPATPPTDDDLDAMFVQTGLAAAVAIDVLEERLARVLDDPSSYNVSGVYQEDYTSTITGLRDKIKRIQAELVTERAAIEQGLDPFAPPEAQGVTLTGSALERGESGWSR